MENIHDINLYVWFQKNGINLNKFYSIGTNETTASNNGTSSCFTINNTNKRNSIDLANRKQLDLNHSYLINFLNNHFSYTGLLYKLNETTSSSTNNNNNNKQQLYYSSNQKFIKNNDNCSMTKSPFKNSSNLIHFKIKDFDLSKNSLLLGGIVPG